MPRYSENVKIEDIKSMLDTFACTSPRDLRNEILRSSHTHTDTMKLSSPSKRLPN